MEGRVAVIFFVRDRECFLRTAAVEIDEVCADEREKEGERHNE